MVFKKVSEREDLNAYLGPGLTIQGDLSFKGKVRFEGHLKGKLYGEKIIIGDTGVIEGEIQAEEILCSGRVEGQIQTRVVHFKKTASFKGDLQAERIAVEEGAQLEGQIKVGEVQTPPSEDGKEAS